jgi:hypothetical protein
MYWLAEEANHHVCQKNNLVPKVALSYAVRVFGKAIAEKLAAEGAVVPPDISEDIIAITTYKTILLLMFISRC